MPPNRFESEVESFLEGSHGDRTHIKRADHPRLHHYAGRYYNTTNNNQQPSKHPAHKTRPDQLGVGGGFCSIRSWLSACRRRVVPLMVQFPPIAGSEAVVSGLAVSGNFARNSLEGTSNCER